MRILYATMEIDPFLKLTSAAAFLKRLPQKMQDKGHEIRILMPKFGVINERRNRLHEVVRLSGINIRVAGEEKPLTIKVATIPNVRLQVYFLDNEDYFKRKAVIKDKKGTFFDDNLERAVFFSKGLIETVRKLGWAPDLVHCHGWMTSLVPLYLSTYYKEDPIFQGTDIAYTLYNNELSLPLPDNAADIIRLDGISDEALAPYVEGTYAHLAAAGLENASVKARGHEELDGSLKEVLDARGYSELAFDGNGDDLDAYVEFYHQLYPEKAGEAAAAAK